MNKNNSKVRLFLIPLLFGALNFVWFSYSGLYFRQSGESYRKDSVVNLTSVNQDEDPEMKPQKSMNVHDSLASEGQRLWEEEQSRRRVVIQKACKGLGFTKDKLLDFLLKSPEKHFQHFLVDDSRRAIYCYIPKVACTNWKKVWMVLRGMTEEKNLTAIPFMTPHDNTQAMEIMNTTKKSDLKLKLASYSKLILVRHPFQRLASAYRDKIHFKEGDSYFQSKVLPYVQKLRSTANETNILWPEFVDYITLGKGRLKDDHWNTYISLCHPCVIDYDVVAKLETLQEDSERFLRLIHAPGDLHFPMTSRTSKRIDDTLWHEYEKQLSSDQLAALYKTYRRDFLLFEYD